MNIVFWILVLLCIILLWFCLSGLFNTIGYIVFNIAKDVKDIINDTEEKGENNEN